MRENRFSVVLAAVLISLACVAAAWSQPTSDLQLKSVAGPDRVIYFYVEYAGIIPSTMSVEFPALSGMDASTSFPAVFVVPAERQAQLELQASLFATPPPANVGLPADATLLFTLTPRPNVGYSYNVQTLVSMGRPVNPNQLDHIYLLPYEHGSKHFVGQGYNGDYTHFGSNQYALDFDLDTGVPIHAARGGVVVEVKEDSNRGGPSAAFAADGNFIRVYHEDGTFASYAHLMQWGAAVEYGDKIQAGQLIGYSGETGQASGPHLHFEVMIPDGKGSYRTIPTKFYGLDGSPIDIEEGEYYYAFHPDKPAFQARYGSDLTDADFVNYSAPVAAGDKIDIRTEEIDDTVVFYAFNTTSQKIRAQVNLQLENASSTRGNRISVEIPPRTEVFLTLLRPIERTEPWRYSSSMRASVIR